MIFKQQNYPFNMTKKQSGLSLLATLLLLIVLGFSFVGYSAYQKYEKKQAAEQAKIKLIKEIGEANTKLSSAMSKYHDALKLAASTSRVALAGPVASLQTIKRETDLISTPPCMVNSKEFLIQGMNTGIQHFLDFMSQKSSSLEQEESVAAMVKQFDNATEAKSVCDNLLKNQK